MIPHSTFEGFPKTGIEILSELPHRDKAWLEDWRDLYNENLLSPTKALVTTLGDEIRKNISNTIITQPKINGSISPIFRDRRFSSDKTIFKDNLMLNFWDGIPKKTAPTLRVRITPQFIGFASGAIFSQNPHIDRWRSSIDDEFSGNDLQRIIKVLNKSLPINQSIAELKNPPIPFNKEHPRANLLKHKSIQIRWQEKTPKCIHTYEFSTWCIKRLEVFKDLHLWLKTNLTV